MDDTNKGYANDGALELAKKAIREGPPEIHGKAVNTQTETQMCLTTAAWMRAPIISCFAPIQSVYTADINEECMGNPGWSFNVVETAKTMVKRTQKRSSANPNHGVPE